MRNPLVLIVSDIHLGAFKSKYKMFHIFLKKIEDGDYGNNLKALIILGDFFDLIMKSPSSFSENEEYQEIFKILNTLQRNHNLHIIFTPGNHEIPIWGNEDLRFNRRKRRLIKKFKKPFQRNNIGVDILNEYNFCQYIILDNENNNFRISLFNSKTTMKKFIDKKKLSRRAWFYEKDYDIIWNDEKKFGCMLCHGHQFDPIKGLASIFWSFGIHSPEFLKKIGNFIWNGLIKGGLIINWKYGKKLKKGLIDKHLIFDTVTERKVNIMLRNLKKLEKHPRNIIFDDLDKKYTKNIKKFVKKLRGLKVFKIKFKRFRKSL